MRRGLGAAGLGIDRLALAVDDVIIDPVFEVARSGLTPEAARVAVVVAEQQLRRALANEAHRRQVRVHCQDLGVAVPAQNGFHGSRLPRPIVARPKLRQEVQRRRLASAIGGDDLHQDIVGRGLRVGDLDVEIPVAVEDAGVEQLEFRVGAAAAPVLFHQPRIGEGRLRILVEHPHPAVARRGVQVVVEFLHVFAVVAFRIGQAEQALFQDRVVLVPQRQAEA
jgi:hypothetical protein